MFSEFDFHSEFDCGKPQKMPPVVEWVLIVLGCWLLFWFAYWVCVCGGRF